MKNVESIKVLVNEDLKNKLFRLAEAQGRTVSDYVRHVLSLHVYGNYERITGICPRIDQGICGTKQEVSLNWDE